MLVTMSPGLSAWPSGRFSEAGTTPITLIAGPSSASALNVPSTLPPPHMSYFISSIAAAGLIEMPPASKVRPLPTSAIGFSPLAPPLYSSTISFGGWRLPRDTDSSAPMPSFSMSACSSTLALTDLYCLARPWATSAR